MKKLITNDAKNNADNDDGLVTIQKGQEEIGFKIPSNPLYPNKNPYNRRFVGDY